MSETVTVTQLNNRAKNLISSSPALTDIWVNGEISNLTRASSGHYYFTLKDSGSEIRAAMFKGSRQRIDFEPKDSMKVSAFGSVDIYVPRGSYQFIVQTMRPAGIGELFLAYEELKKKLEAEGLFEQSRKRPLPRYPRRIGVVTSETGAVIHDIIMTSASRFPADIILAPSMVQGEGAADTIVKGIELLNRYGVDIVVVARGGGSLEDLWSFNEEKVARAIASSKAPVVSAVGHETDFTIADFVADVRAPTPTGAAAIMLRDRMETSSEVVALVKRANIALRAVTERMYHRFQLVDAKLSPQKALSDIGMRCMHLDELYSRARSSVEGRMSAMRHRFDVADAKLSPGSALDRMEIMSASVENSYQRIESSLSRRMDASAARLESVSGRLSALDPRNVLSRGYGMVTSSDGTVVTSVSGLKEGCTVSIGFRDGSAEAEIKEVSRDERVRGQGRADGLRGEHGGPRGAGEEA